MGKWGCRGIPPGRQPFHHLLRMTADLKVCIRTLTLTHTHIHWNSSLSWAYKENLQSTDCDTLDSGIFMPL